MKPCPPYENGGIHVALSSFFAAKAIAPIPLLVYADTRDALVRNAAQQRQVWLAQTRGPYFA